MHSILSKNPTLHTVTQQKCNKCKWCNSAALWILSHFSSGLVWLAGCHGSDPTAQPSPGTPGAQADKHTAQSCPKAVPGKGEPHFYHLSSGTSRSCSELQPRCSAVQLPEPTECSSASPARARLHPLRACKPAFPRCLTQVVIQEGLSSFRESGVSAQPSLGCSLERCLQHHRTKSRSGMHGTPFPLTEPRSFSTSACRKAFSLLPVPLRAASAPGTL